ncbi:hypothetical protein MKQ68_17410 [Chitinophaga horti]|uniref:LTXXQ motif family protein n=1 Tax=Chitinophaga horti TaxID=2920382 RepID=A0ABY6IZP4_9BACT|nr:hypothetical protein [Chitinophaga horti]UYQ91867.1 hypothetical protein MKQ68_17410 [Chitinophaga horti]
MKRTSYPGLLATLLLLLSFAATHAQDTARSDGRWNASAKADKLSDKIDKELNLTKEQAAQIHTINTDISHRRDAIKRDTTIAKKQQLLQVRALDAERSQRFKTVLTPVQYKKWNDWEMKKKERLEAKMDKKQDKKLAKQH